MDNQVDLMGTLLTIHQASVKPVPFKIKSHVKQHVLSTYTK